MKFGKSIKVISTTLAVLMSMSVLFTGCGANNSESTQSQSTLSTAATKSPTTDSTNFQNPTVMGIELKNLSLDGTLNGQFKGKTLKIATMTGDFDQSVKDTKGYFEQLSGGKVEVNSFPGENYMEKIQLDLNSGHTFDVVIMPIALIHGYAQGGLVQDLSTYLKNNASPGYDVNDFLPGIYNAYAKYNGKIVSLPYKPDVQMFFYRKDLFDDAKVKEQFKQKTGKDLKVPESPEEMLEAAKFFTKSLNPDSPVTYGYSTMASQGNSRWIWTNRLALYGDKDVDENFKPAFNNEGGIKALDFVKSLAECAPKQWQQYKWEEANNAFIQGNIAMMEQWPGLYSTINSDASKVKGKVGYTVTPGKTPTLGGWGIAMTATAKEADMAFKYMEFITSKDGEVLKIKNTMDPSRISNFNRPEIKSSNEQYPALQESLKGATVLADVDVPFISSKLNDIEELAIQNALNNKMSSADAIKWMAENFDKEIKAAGISK